MRSKVQLKDGYCEVNIKSDYGVNQKVKLKEGVNYLLYSDKYYSIKDIRFNEDTNNFEYLLEASDFSRFWGNQKDLQEVDNLSNINKETFYNTFITMKDYSEYKLFESIILNTSASSGLESLSSIYLNNDLKDTEFNFDFSTSINLKDFSSSKLTQDELNKLLGLNEEGDNSND